ncbi:hypothetical protein PT974_08377 [Cladobotryum mycophilum]|uniref:Heterokaryon incompatibility domain-containing protein n=1 Tax=Cladobotryum mycophilum TaxID=491253 RepID=A0ABR0SD59_9HYPO
MIIDPTYKPVGIEKTPMNTCFLKEKLNTLLSSPSTCRFSQWLITSWSTKTSWQDLKSRSQEVYICISHLSHGFDPLPLTEIDWIGLWDPKEPYDENTGRCKILTYAYLDVVAVTGDPAAAMVTTRPINPQIGSQENFALARSWVSECLEIHTQCTQPTLAFMPKIVLKVGQVGSDYNATLHYPSSMEPYTALSYCWGGDQPHKTTKDRVNSGDLALDCKRLPASIQDAIKVTVGLGFTYLWVDSLCIVQDDDSDKAQQIALMPEIYSNAVVTISATRANRAVDGFLHEIDIDSITELAVKLSFRCPDSSIGTVFLVKIRDSLGPEPIDRRGWTLQERYLSPRFLEYAEKQMSWACSESGDKPGYSDGWKIGTREDTLGLNIPYNFYSQYINKEDPTWRQDVENSWRTVVEKYTRRSLTVSKDRSLAISGVAARFSSILQDEYIAGHWKQTLPYDLLWNIDTGIVLQGRPVEHQAPSWSWAAVNGSISFTYAQSARPSDLPTPKPVITHLEVCTELEEEKAIFGAVAKGYIRGQGKFRQALWFGNQEAPDHLHSLHEMHSDGSTGPIPLIRMRPDAREKEFSNNASDTDISIPVHLLYVGTCIGLRLRGRVGLVLRELPTTMTRPWRQFSRVGLFHILNPSASKRKSLGVPRPWDSLAIQDNQDFFSGSVLEKFELI